MFKTLDIIGCKCIFSFHYIYVFVPYAPKSPTANEIKILSDFFIGHYQIITQMRSYLSCMSDFNIPEIR